jgi:thymidylate synthase
MLSAIEYLVALALASLILSQLYALWLSTASMAPPKKEAAASPDTEYLALLQRILDSKDVRDTRNGRVLCGQIGERIVFRDIVRQFPLLTTKRMFWRGIVEELLWFLSGSTDISKLRAKDVHIWDGNSTRAYLDSVGLTGYAEHKEAGPAYGWQFRHFGAEYHGCMAPSGGEGVDQIATVIRSIRQNPSSRRHVISLWNAAQVDQAVLPPCHVLYQYDCNVVTRRLSCLMYMRSCDVFLGLPFNIASSALLLMLVAAATGYEAGDLTVIMCNAHVYEEHVGAAKEQLTRQPFESPRVVLLQRPNSVLSDVSDEFIALMGYKCHGALKAPMKA